MAMGNDDKTQHRHRKKILTNDTWLNRRTNRAKPQEHIAITDAHVKALIAERERTKVGPAAFIAHFSDIPDDLRTHVIERWINRQVKTARAGLFEFVLERYRSLPTPPQHVQAPLQAGRILITDEMLELLESELERTGAPLTHLVRMRSPDAFRLTASKISAWRKRRALKANRAEWDSVIDVLQSMPDRKF